MVLKTEIQAEIVATPNKKSFNDGVNFARDTGKKIDQALRTKLTFDIAEATVKLKGFTQELKTAQTQADKIRVQVKIDEARNNLTELKRQLKNLTNTGDVGLSRLQSKFDKLGEGIVNNLKGMIGAAAAIGLVTRAFQGLKQELVLSGEAAQKFEKQMSNVSTLIDTSTESMDDMSKELLAIAERVPVSIEELTTALYDVRSAGIGAEDAMSVLEQSARLATAGLGTTKEAVNLMTSAFNAFSSQGYNAEQIASTFFLAVKNGKTTIAELSQGFGKLAAVASNLGIDFKELVAATTALTTTGLSASEAYTQIQGILVAVAKGGNQAIEAAKGIGFEFTASALASKGLKGFLDELAVALKDNGYEGARATEVLSKMFGRVEALSGVLGLTNANAEAFINTLNEMTGESVAFLEAFDKQAATVDARMQKLQNRLEVQRIELGNTTSMWRGFGTYLKIEFLDILNKIGKLFTAVADIAVGSFRIIASSFKDLGSGISGAIDNFFDTGKFNFKDAFNFESTKSELKKLKDNVVSTFDDSSKKQAAAVKNRNDVIKKLEEDNSNNTIETHKYTSKELEKIEKERIKKINEEIKKETERYKEKQKEKADAAETTYDIIDKAVKDSAKTLEDYNKKIKDIEKSLEDLDKDTATSLADRVIEIEDALKNATDLEERVDLSRELQLAKGNVSEEDIKQARERADESPTERIIRESKEEKQVLEAKLSELKDAKDQEQKIFEDLDQARRTIAESFERFDIGKKDAEKARVQSLIDKYRELNAVKSGSTISTGGGSAGSTTNNTTNNTVNKGGVTVTINAETNATPDQIKQAVVDAVISYDEGNNL